MSQNFIQSQTEINNKLIEYPLEMRSSLVSTMILEQEIYFRKNLKLLEHQKIPKGNWKYWLNLSSRGSGKSVCGRNAIKEFILTGTKEALVLYYDYNTSPKLYNLFEAWCKPKIISSKPYDEAFLFDNGAIINFLNLRNNINQIHGIKHELIWADEPMCLENLEYNILRFKSEKYILTLTPTSYNFEDKFKYVLEHADTVITKGTIHDNKANLHPEIFNNLISGGVV